MVVDLDLGILGVAATIKHKKQVGTDSSGLKTEYSKGLNKKGLEGMGFS